MGVQKLISTFDARIKKNGVECKDNLFRVRELRNGMPSALWGKSAQEGKLQLLDTPPDPKTMTLSLAAGVCIATVAPDPTPDPNHKLPPMRIRDLLTENLEPKTWRLDGRFTVPELAGDGDKPLFDTIMRQDIVTKRKAMLELLARQSPFELYQPDLTRLVKVRSNYFQAGVGSSKWSPYKGLAKARD